MNKPNCYKCQYRGNVPGDAHSCCRHPVLEGADQFDLMVSVLEEILSETIDPKRSLVIKAIIKLNIKAEPHGINNGWFYWPWNFDPTWLKNCEGFTEKTFNQ